MEFEWDEDKRLANLAKHGIDFNDVLAMWDGEVIDPAGERLVGEELRHVALGILGEDENCRRGGVYRPGGRETPHQRATGQGL